MTFKSAKLNDRTQGTNRDLPRQKTDTTGMSFVVLLTIVALAMVENGLARADDPDQAQFDLVRNRLGPLQHLSFATNREYCGYLYRLPDGRLEFTEMVRGGRDGCTPVVPLKRIELVASVHTHGAYDPSVPAEFPTVLDMDSDKRERVNGYVATPGGRLWFIDTRSGITYQVCGIACLPQDPGFHVGDDGEIAGRYTYRDLVELESLD